MSSDSLEKLNQQTPTRRSPCSRSDGGSPALTDDSPEQRGRDDGKGVVMEKVRNLRKRPSRFRMNMKFWGRSKSASPPVPSGGLGRGGGSDGEGSLSLG